MEQHFLINGNSIKVTLEEGAIHIFNDEELWKLLNEGMQTTTESLIVSVKKAYERLYKKELDISSASLAVEIWGHVYFEYFAIIFEKLVHMNLIKQMTNKISSYCEIIDCGESEKDSNRFFWDILAPFRNQIAALLPEKIAEKHIKNRG